NGTVRDRRRPEPHDRDLRREQLAHHSRRQRDSRRGPQVRGQGERDRGQTEELRPRGVRVMGEEPTREDRTPHPRGEGEKAIEGSDVTVSSQANSPLPAGRVGQAGAGVGSSGSLLGVDYGTKRIGLAVCDPNRVIASPLETTPNDFSKEAFF